MTFSICVHENYETETDEGDLEEHDRFGVAVTTRLAGVGTLCPFVSENGAVATQSLVNTRLGRKGIEYVDDGLAVGDALQSLLDADENSENRQLHGVDREGTFTFSGEECKEWYGHTAGEGYTVAGNLLTGESVVAETAAAYEASDPEEPLSERLIDALAAGHAEGGDKREDLPVHSAAVMVARTEERELASFTDDLRVDATETPIEDLRETYELAERSFEDAMDRYEDAYEEDSVDGVADDEGGEAATDG
ncbi:DUF1028 domain-containing protein [Salinirubellus salinus]|uniref:DUF1028 domain-containing protein n=1 Tax=Salinirubellus salinus TaxID=1364945 RepID=A0A9E7R1A1_9EURY|nr:DUF1028 domain-containing protein [Salinirubellus salinus]UWM53683.1 DUF1028 domain-containing protein [Salinirubellus salinus]